MPSGEFASGAGAAGEVDVVDAGAADDDAAARRPGDAVPK